MMFQVLSEVSAQRGQRTDAGTVLAMIGFGMFGGGFVAACAGFSRWNGNTYSPRYKRWARRVGAAGLAIGIPLAILGIFTHHR